MKLLTPIARTRPPASHVDALLKQATVVPAVNQVEVHPYFTQPAVQVGDAAHGVGLGGTDEQKERWLRGIAVGDLVFSESISEKNAGSSFKTIPGVGDHPLDTLEVGDHVVVGSKAWTHSTVAGSKAWTHSTSACAAVLSRTTSRSRPKAGPSPKPHHTPREPPRGSIGATAPPRPGPGSLSRQSSGVSSVSGVTPLKLQSR